MVLSLHRQRSAAVAITGGSKLRHIRADFSRRTQLGVALSLDHADGPADDSISGGIHLETGFKFPSFCCVEPIVAAGGLLIPVGIEVPDVEEVSGVVAQEDLVDTADGVSGQHLPFRGVGASREIPGGGDFLLQASANLHEGLAIAVAKQFGVALGFCCDEGSAGDSISGGIHLETGFKFPSFCCVEPIVAAGGLLIPVGIEVPDVEEVSGVVAQEDLVDTADGVSGQHLPFRGVGASREIPGGGDFLLQASANLHEGLAIAALEQLCVALGFQGNVVVGDGAGDGGCGADGVAGTGREGEGDGFVWRTRSGVVTPLRRTACLMAHR